MGIFAAALLILSACASTQPKISADAKREIQYRAFEDASYDGVFRALIAAVKSDGYILREENAQEGRIVATVQNREGAGMWEVVKGDRRYRENEQYEVTLRLKRTEPETILTKASLRRIEPFSLGGRREEEIVDKKPYEAFYAKVHEELERRKATGKK
jgi:hypothetical protein